jgi:hypothetical protein
MAKSCLLVYPVRRWPLGEAALEGQGCLAHS